MRRELVAENIEQHKLLSGEELGRGQIGSKRDGGRDLSEEGGCSEKGVEHGGATVLLREPLAQLEVPGDERIRHGLVQLGVVPRAVDRNYALERLVVQRRVAHHVMCKVVLCRVSSGQQERETNENFEREEEAGLGDDPLPVEYTPAQHLDLGRMPSALRSALHRSNSIAAGRPPPLQALKPLADLDDAVARALVHIGLLHRDVVQDVAHQSPVSRANLVNDQVLVGEQIELVLGDEEARNRPAIPRLSLCQRWPSRESDVP